MYQRILVVVDNRPVARAAILEGTALAQAHGAEVVFFSVLPSYTLPIADMPVFADVSPQQFEREAQAEVDRLLAGASVVADKAGVRSRTASGSGEDDAAAIIDAARRRRCDLIVVASEGRNAIVRLLTGSPIPGLITASPLPVLVCKPRAAARKLAGVAMPPAKARSARKAAVAPKPRRRALV